MVINLLELESLIDTFYFFFLRQSLGLKYLFSSSHFLYNGCQNSKAFHCHFFFKDDCQNSKAFKCHIAFTIVNIRNLKYIFIVNVFYNSHSNSKAHFHYYIFFKTQNSKAPSLNSFLFLFLFFTTVAPMKPPQYF